jgi:ribosomal protein S27AE
MPTPAVGEDIEDVCTRCGDSWHVVMAKLGERIAKVVCKRCGSQHSYRGVNGVNEAPAANGGGARRMLRRRPTRSNPVAPPDLPVFDPDKAPRPYSARDLYLPGERIEHPTFGTGVVAATPGPGKVDVVFPSGERTLACAKTESTLARPVAVSNAPIGDRPPPKNA